MVDKEIAVTTMIIKVTLTKLIAYSKYHKHFKNRNIRVFCSIVA